MDNRTEVNRDKVVTSDEVSSSYVLDHIAVVSTNIRLSVDWHVKELGATVLYEDETWGLVRLDDRTKIAFVSPGHHPPHVGLRPSCPAPSGLTKHRDGSESTYVKDPHSSAVYEWIWYPTSEDQDRQNRG